MANSPPARSQTASRVRLRPIAADSTTPASALNINWVGGRDGYVNFNPDQAMPSGRIGLGMMSLLPGNKEVPHSHPDAELNIVLSGKVVTTVDGQTTELHPLDALYCPAGQVHALRNHGDVPAAVLWVSEAPRRRGG